MKSGYWKSDSTKAKQMKTPKGVIANKVELPPAEEVADSIVQIANIMKRLFESRLSRGAIVALIHDKSGLKKGDIELVLNNLEDFDRIWLKPLPKKN